MKHLLAVLLCLLLCGCAPQTIPETAVSAETVPEKVSMYAPNHPMEQAHPGEVRAYPLTLRNVHGIRAFGKDVLTLSGYGSTTLTLLTGEELWEKARITLDFDLYQEDPALRIHEESLSFFDPQAKETVVLDNQLQEIRRIAAPSGLTGRPLLSDDGNTLYYCTDWAVMAWNLETGIRRTVREVSGKAPELTGLYCNSTVLGYRSEDTEMLLISADNGTEQKTLPSDAQLSTWNSRYFAAIPAGKMTLLVFGEEDSDCRMLLPERFPDSRYYMPEDHAAVTVRDTDNGIALDYYELGTGMRRASLLLDPFQTPKTIVNCKGHALYILAYDPDADCDILYRWDVLQQPPEAGNTTSHTFPYCSANAPDLPSLEACREYADAIGAKYGITIRIWEEAAAVQPWDYQFTPEHLAPILLRELKMLDNALAQYPAAILQKTAEHYSGLTISLVRQITGTPESDGPGTATGIQFFLDGKAYAAISAGKYARQALFHELYHAMESYILTESTALDQWEALNPAGFVYGTETQDTEVYLQGLTRAFVDRYSTTYPSEDRARIFEYAMLSGNEELFHSEYMQRKLNALCTAIRDAYGLKRSPDPLPWEQYLVTPLAPNA